MRSPFLALLEGLARSVAATKRLGPRVRLKPEAITEQQRHLKVMDVLLPQLFAAEQKVASIRHLMQIEHIRWHDTLRKVQPEMGGVDIIINPEDGTYQVEFDGNEAHEQPGPPEWAQTLKQQMDSE